MELLTPVPATPTSTRRPGIFSHCGFYLQSGKPIHKYQNGVDFHLDWAASQFLSKQFLVGVVGYLYQEVGCDSGSGDHIGCFQSRVVGLGPQVGDLFPIGDLQGYLNLKAYGEFAAQDRPTAGTSGSRFRFRVRRQPRLLQRRRWCTNEIKARQAKVSAVGQEWPNANRSLGSRRVCRGMGRNVPNCDIHLATEKKAP
jgi:hypothetical protein